jgi:acetylornithine deacetylase/succinyl-diaminopimelate desuccinylase-like protein
MFRLTSRISFTLVNILNVNPNNINLINLANMSTLNDIAVKKLIEYIRIKTVHPEPDYQSAVRFLRSYAEEIGFDDYKELEVSPGRVVVLMSYYGTAPDKQSILLNSHTDVVPVDQVNIEPFYLS